MLVAAVSEQELGSFANKPAKQPLSNQGGDQTDKHANAPDDPYDHHQPTGGTGNPRGDGRICDVDRCSRRFIKGRLCCL